MEFVEFYPPPHQVALTTNTSFNDIADKPTPVIAQKLANAPSANVAKAPAPGAGR
jgi:hypothetical protein